LKISIKAELRVMEGEDRRAKAIHSALKPDDTAPRELLLQSVVKGDTVTYIIKASGDPALVLKVRNTLDDILGSIELAEKAISTGRR